MSKLLISKINDIQIIQVGESKLSIQNKSEDGGKIGGGRKIGFEGDGVNKTIDLGKGKKKHTLKIYAFDRNESDALMDIFYNKRYCTIIDKFKGKIKVYIDSIDVTDSDKHVNRTIFDISCTVQDADFSPSINFRVRLASTIIDMEDEISGMVSKLARNASTVETRVNPLNGALNFVDSSLDLVRSGIDDVLDVKLSVFGAYQSVKSRIDTGKRLFESIKGIKAFPDELTDVLKKITNDGKKGKSNYLNKVRKSEITPIATPQASDVNVENLSQFEVEELQKETAASEIVNKVKAIKDMRSILEGGFHSQDDFEETVNSTLQRIEHVGYERDVISDKAYLIKSFANQQEYRDIIEIDVKNNTPLLALVYDRDGDLGNYQSIEAMNELMDNDSVKGTVKVFR